MLESTQSCSAVLLCLSIWHKKAGPAHLQVFSKASWVSEPPQVVVYACRFPSIESGGDVISLWRRLYSIVYKAVACLVQLHASYRLPGILAGQLDVLHL